MATATFDPITIARAAHECEQLLFITASHKKRKLAQEARPDLYLHRDADSQTTSDDVDSQPSLASSTTISATSNSQRSTQSPPRYIPSYLQDEISDSETLRSSNTTTAGTSPSDAYANLTLGGDFPGTVVGSATSEEPDTAKDNSRATPTTPRQARLSATKLARSASPRSSSPAKRSAATLEEDNEARPRDAMDIDKSSPPQDSLDDTEVATGAGNMVGNAANTIGIKNRAVSIDMLGERQTDSQLASNTGSEATSVSNQDSNTSASSYGSTTKMATDQDIETLHMEYAPDPDAPPLDEQVTRIHQMYNEVEEKDGAVGYVLSGAWYRRVVAKTAEGQKTGEFSKTDMEAEIGPVDNSDLISEGKQWLWIFPYLRNARTYHIFCVLSVESS